MKKSKTIKSEVVKTFLTVTCLILIMGATLIFSSTKSVRTFEELSQIHLDRMTLGMKIRKELSSIIFKYQILATGNALEPMGLLGELRKSKVDLESDIESFKASLKASEPNAKLDEKVLFIEKNYPNLEDVGNRMAIAFLNGDQVDGSKLRIEVQKYSGELFNALKSLNQSIQTAVSTDVSVITGFLKGVGTGAFALIAFSLVLTLFSVFRLIRFVNTKINETAQSLTQQSEGLTVKVTEIGQGLEKNSDKLAQTASSLNQISKSLTSSTTDQSAALQESVASIQEITSMVKQTAEHSRDSMEVANQCRDDVKLGSSVVSRMRTSVAEISESNDQLSDIIQIFSNINNKTKIINDIVTKTELLSFNASIEAARAGEHGKGFAVVAEEVGNLARLSGQASEEIQVLLDESNNRVNGIIDQIKPRVNTGEETVKECVSVFEQIEGQIVNLSGMVTSISSAASEQQQGLEQSTAAMNQIEKSTHESRAVIDDSNRMANELEDSAADVIELVKSLNDLAEQNRKDVQKVSEAYSGGKNEGAEVIEMPDRTSPPKRFSQDDVARMYKDAGDGATPSRNDDRF